MDFSLIPAAPGQIRQVVSRLEFQPHHFITRRIIILSGFAISSALEKDERFLESSMRRSPCLTDYCLPWLAFSLQASRHGSLEYHLNCLCQSAPRHLAIRNESHACFEMSRSER